LEELPCAASWRQSKPKIRPPKRTYAPFPKAHRKAALRFRNPKSK
jgi:hypothetical protein